MTKMAKVNAKLVKWVQWAVGVPLALGLGCLWQAMFFEWKSLNLQWMYIQHWVGIEKLTWLF